MPNIELRKKNINTFSGTENLYYVKTTWALIDSVPSTFTPTSHSLTAGHTVSGLTTGHFLKATGATTFGFVAHGLNAAAVGAVDTTDVTETATASKVVRRDANGYIYGTYFNSNRGNEATTAASYIYDSGDGWMRKKTLANAQTEIVTKTVTETALGFTTHKNGTVINPTDTTAHAYGYCNSISLFGQTDGGLISHAFDSNWQGQIYQDYRTGQLAIRGKNSGTWNTTWRTVVDSTNYNTYITYSNIGASPAGHTHPYASDTHNHNDVYAIIAHNHDSVYAITGHNHNGVYSDVAHDHNTAYLATTHAASGVTTTKITNWDAASTHAGTTHAPSNAQKNSDITIAEIEAKLTGAITTHKHGSIVETRASGDTNFWVGTQAQYDAIGTKSTTTLYFVT